MFEVSESTWRFLPSSASAKKPRSASQKSWLKRRLSSAASRSSRSAQAGSFHSVAREPRGAELGVVHVALDLAGRARQLGDRPVGEGDRVPRILPALVVEARSPRAALVFDVAVAVAIAVARRSSRSAARAAARARARARCRRSSARTRRAGSRNSGVASAAAVVGRVRPLLERGQLAQPELVQDLARFFVAEGRPRVPGSSASVAQRRRGELGREGQGLKLVMRLSRPKRAMNHGSPAAGSVPRGERELNRGRRNR